MPAFQNIIDLRMAVADHVGNRAISDVFQMLVELAESDLNSRLRTRYQIVESTLYFDDGISAFPPDYMELVSVTDTRGRPLHPSYQVDGFNFTLPGYSGDINVRYYGRLPSLTSSPTASNWLLKRYPAVYLYGVGLQAAKHLKDVELAQATDQLYGYALGALTNDDYRARWANQRVRVQGATP